MCLCVNVWVCVCICATLCVSICECICVACGCVYIFQEVNIDKPGVKVGRVHLLNSALIFWNKVSHWTWRSLFPIGRTGSNWGSTCLCPLSHSIQKCGSLKLEYWNTQYLHQDQWSKLSSSHFCSKYFIWYAAVTAVNHILYTGILWNRYQILTKPLLESLKS